MSFLPTGTVYGVLLNFRAEAQALAPQMREAPYKAPPNAPDSATTRAASSAQAARVRRGRRALASPRRRTKVFMACS